MLLFIEMEDEITPQFEALNDVLQSEFTAAVLEFEQTPNPRDVLGAIPIGDGVSVLGACDEDTVYAVCVRVVDGQRTEEWIHIYANGSMDRSVTVVSDVTVEDRERVTEAIRELLDEGLEIDPDIPDIVEGMQLDVFAGLKASLADYFNPDEYMQALDLTQPTPSELMDMIALLREAATS